MVIRVTITTMAATGNITTARLQLFGILIVATAALFTLSLSWPRLQASLLYLPVDTAISRYWDSRETPSEQLQGLQQRAEKSISIYPHYRYWDGLSLLYFLEGGDGSKPLIERRQAFERAIDAAAASLARAPSQPRAWFRIASARAWLKYPPQEVIAALKMAVYTGRVDPSLFIARLTLGLSYLPMMDQEGIDLMRDQALLAWRLQPREVTGVLKSKALMMTRMEYLLADAHGNVLADMEESLGGAIR